jgi:hypothetical protein
MVAEGGFANERVGNNLGVESQVFIEEQIKPFMQEKLVCREE